MRVGRTHRRQHLGPEGGVDRVSGVQAPAVDTPVEPVAHDVGQRLLVFSEKQTAVGVELLTTVSREWVTIVLRHGGAMIHTRSETGYLTRLRDRTEYLTAQAQALQHPIASAAEELGLGNPGDIGLFLWNILFDAREIIDLRDSEHLDADGINARLIGTLCGALRGWQAADARDAAPAAP